MTGMDELITFLRAQLDDDERVAREATGGAWEVGPNFGGKDNRVYVRAEDDLIDSVGTCVIAGQVSNVPQWRGNAEHIARWDPARVLAEVEAKRRILDWCAEVIGTRDLSRYGQFGALASDKDALAVTLAVETARLIAQPHHGRDGWREEWAT